jgi:predicted RNase H-like nuclease (RuvC/YqgF family)
MNENTNSSTTIDQHSNEINVDENKLKELQNLVDSLQDENLNLKRQLARLQNTDVRQQSSLFAVSCSIKKYIYLLYFQANFLIKLLL